MALKDPIIIPSIPPLTLPLIPKVEPEESDEVIATSYLGTPVYSNLIFEANANTPENTDIRIDTVVMTVTQLRNIVKTPIQGRDGTVKEYINNGDYQIECNGLIVSPQANVFPRNDIEALNNLMTLNSSIVVSSSFLNLFNISDVVVEEFSFAEQEGYRNQCAFTFRLISDDPIEIKVNA